MGADLILAADAAYPFKLSLLPAGCQVVLGYLGRYGATPHLWTAAEIAVVKQSGRDWWPIWTPQQNLMGRESGIAAAAGADTACQVVGIALTRPVFIDIEAGTWSRNPAAAAATVAGFKQEMKRRGRPNAFGYVPLAAGFDWVAHWTGLRPATLPAGWVGQQYAHAVAADAYDLSVFDLAALRQVSRNPGPAGQIEGQLEMFIVRDSTNGAEYLQASDGTLTHLGSAASVDAYTRAGVPLITDIDPGDLAKFAGYGQA